MGLDMWLVAKKCDIKGNKKTGVCNGFFGIIPATVNEGAELGYWRKAWDQREVILANTSSGTQEDGNIRILPAEVDAILAQAKEILKTHTFDEDGFDITEDYDGTMSTWCSKSKWEDTVEFFEKAKKVLEEYPEAEIYYHEWY